MGFMKLWCLHGAVGLAADWDDFKKRMEMEGHQVHAIDLWSYLDDGDSSFEDFAGKLCAEARKESVPPVLIGYSMGGRLALHALIEDSMAWSGAMLISAHPGLEAEEERIRRMAADAEWAAKILSGGWERFLNEWENQPILQGHCKSPLADRSNLRERQVAVARGFTSWSLGKQQNLRNSLKDIDKPVVWLAGKRDQKFASLADLVWSQMSDSYLLGPLDAGHRVPWEAPEEFSLCVEHLLDLINR